MPIAVCHHRPARLGRQFAHGFVVDRAAFQRFDDFVLRHRTPAFSRAAFIAPAIFVVQLAQSNRSTVASAQAEP